MRQDETRIGRRGWLTWVTAVLAGCGGGGNDGADTLSSGASGSGSGTSGPSGPSGQSGPSGTSGATNSTETAAASPGTGGTGISVSGPISGFGSIVINGVHYDERGAHITVDGASVDGSALRLGMVADVSGTRAADGLTGVADSIVVWSVAQGAITQVEGSTFTVMGMRLALHSMSVVDVDRLSEGRYVQVWGLQADTSGRSWQVTRVAAADSSPSVVTGTVKKHDGVRSVNGIRLVGDKAHGLSEDVIYRLQGQWDGEGQQLEVQSVRRVEVAHPAASGKEVEIEGVVTSTLSGSRFTLGAVTVDASAVLDMAATLQVGQRVEVEGRWQGAVLVATEVEREDD